MAKTVDDIIKDIFLREGGQKVTNDPSDPGGRTQYGISERANADLWADGKVTPDEALTRYKTRYYLVPGFDKITHEPLKLQLVDYGVTSGPALAIMKLQQILGVTADGVLGLATLATLASLEPSELRTLNNSLVKLRAITLGRLVQKRPAQLKDLVGWLSRALDFLE